MKPQNMKSVTRTRTSPDQKDRGLGFNGQDNGSSQSARAQGYAGNQHAGKTDPNKTFNFGRGDTVGATSRLVEGPNRPPVSSVPAFEKYKGPQDSLNFGKQERTPSGTRPFEPKMGQNYRGNADSINEGRGPTVGHKPGPAK